MDKKSLLIGVVCLFVAFGLMSRQSIPVQPNGASIKENLPVQTSEISAAIDDIGKEIKEVNPEKIRENVEEPPTLVTLENDSLRVVITSKGAGIKEVLMKEYPAQNGKDVPFVFNDSSTVPALSLAFGDSQQLLSTNYQIAEFSKDKVVLRKVLKSGIAIERIYQFKSGEDDYILEVATRFANTTQKVFDLGNVFIGLGYFLPTQGDRLGEYLNFGYYDGNKAHFIRRNDFRASSGFLGIGKSAAKKEISGEDKIIWGSVKNQFFTGIYTPEYPGNGFVSEPKEFINSEGGHEESVIGSIRCPVGILKAGQSKVLKGEFYIGPKDYVRLDRLGQNQDLVMQFGVFGFVSKVLLLLMKGIHSLIGNWGIAVILLTVIVKLLLWPLTTAQVRSSRKMSKLQEPLKKIKEKYRDNPQRLQSETLKLFKENRVNPAAGCLPIFIQIPIFLGLYFMLRTTAEMRFASFLWIHDLSLPDTVGHIGAFPINILPIIMGISMIYQMKIMPTPSMESAQKWMMKSMPIIFLVFCYNFPSALVLYWTVQNLLTILQQMILNKKDDDALFIDDLNPRKKKI